MYNYSFQKTHFFLQSKLEKSKNQQEHRNAFQCRLLILFSYFPIFFLFFLYIRIFKLRRAASTAFATALLRIGTANAGLPALFRTNQIPNDRSRDQEQN